MVHQKFLKINGKTYGPYYYESYREDGKVKKRYILHQESSLNKRIFLPLIIIIACLGIVFLLYSPLTGKSIQDKSQKVNIPEAESQDKSPNIGIPEAVPSSPDSKTPTIGIPETNEPNPEPALGSTQESENTTKQKIEYVIPENHTKEPTLTAQADCGGVTPCNCGDNLTSSWTMTGDLVCPGNNGLVINANDITLNCNGFNFTGSGANIGIILNGVNNTIIQNCKVFSFYDGIHAYFGSNITITDTITSNNAWMGLELEGPCSNNTLTNITSNNNGYNAVYFYNTSFSTVTGLSSQNNTESGISLELSDSNNITDLNIRGSPIRIFASSYLNFVNSMVFNSTGYGIIAIEGLNNNFLNMNISNSVVDGVYINNMSYCQLSNITTYSNSNNGVTFENDCHDNNLTNSRITGNANVGINIIVNSYNNTIHNNFFNNTNNSYDNSVDGNFWNISKIAGTNILGKPYIGGNFWSDYAGVDNTGDYLGDTFLPYNSSNNISVGGDYLPLVNNIAVTCGVTLTTDTTLSGNLLNSTGGTICPGERSGLIIGANGITLDCAGFSMASNNTGIGINISGFDNTIIKNCYIKDFGNGMNITNSKGMQIINTTLFDNNNYGIYIYRSSNNSITDCTFNSTSQASPDQTDGIYLVTSSNNTIINSMFDSQSAHSVLIVTNSMNNTISNNTFVDKGVYVGNGGASTSGNNHTTIENNTFFTTVASSYAIYFNCVSGLYCEDNSISDNYMNTITSESIFLNYATDSKIYNNFINKSGSSGALYGIHVVGDGQVEVYNNTVLNSASSGIYTSSNARAHIYNNTIRSSGSHGIYINSVANSTIEDNIIEEVTRTSSFAGIYLAANSANTAIKRNYINDSDYGIYLDNAPNTTIESNVMNNTVLGLLIFGDISSELELNIDNNNLVNGKYIYVLRDAQGQEINGWTNASMFFCYNCSNVNVSNMQLTANNTPVILFKDSDTVNIDSIGISGKGSISSVETDKDTGEVYLFNSQDININNTTLRTALSTPTGYGIFSINSSLIIENVDIRNFYEGIYLTSSDYASRIKNATLINNNDVGVYLLNVNDTVIENCSFNNTGSLQSYGAYIWSGKNNTIINSVFDMQTAASIDIYSATNNTAILNNMMLDAGIIVGSSNHNLLIENNTLITPALTPLDFSCTSECNSPIVRNNFIHSGVTSIALVRVSDSEIYNNFINKSGAGTNAYGISLDGNSKRAYIYNNTIQYPGAHGFFINGADNNAITNNTIRHITRTGEYAGIFLGTAALNNTFSGNFITNCTYGILISDAGSTNNTIYNNFFNNTINAKDLSNNTWNKSYSCNLGSGQNIIGEDCMGGNYWGGARGYTGLDDGSGSDVHAIAEDGIGDTILPYNSTNNISYGKGDFLPLVYITNLPPTITFGLQDPADITVTNLFSNPLMINYSITDNSDGVNLSTVKLYYKSNSTLNNIHYYLNGTAVSGYFSADYLENVSGNFTWRLLDNEVYPGIYNLGPITIDNLNHYTNASTNTYFVKTQYYNISNISQWGIFEIMANSTISANPASVYYCNSSYSSGDVSTIADCNLLSTKIATTSFDHCHLNQSCHNIFQFNVNSTAGTIGTVKVTSTSYFLFGTTDSNWQIYNVPQEVRAAMTQVSTDANSSIWENQTYIVDEHVHQYPSVSVGNSTFYYYVCANDTLGNQDCSIIRNDLLELAGLPPTSPNVYSPISGYYYGNISINYTAAESPNNYQIIQYNISLLNQTYNFNQTIVGNNSNNLSYIWDSVGTSEGGYIIRVEACDSLSQCSFGFSENFTIAVPEYPQFSNFWDNNASLIGNGTALFNVTVTSTNGTVFIHIIDADFAATNLTADMYNVSVNLTAGVYDYYWLAYGNGTSNNYNASSIRSYTAQSITACGDKITSDTSLNSDLICSENGLIIGADNITLDCQGYSINGSSSFPYLGINITNQSNVTIKNCIIENFYKGLYLLQSNQNQVVNNTIDNNVYDGIYLEYSDNNTIVDNTASNNLQDTGIWLNKGTGNNISNNFFQGNYYDLWVDAPDGTYQCNNIIQNNNGTGNLSILYINGSSIIEDEIVSALVLCNIPYSIINNVTVIGQNQKNAIVGYYITNTNFTNNNITNIDGIYTYNSTNNTLINNTFEELFSGVFIRGSYNYITNNLFFRVDGLYLNFESPENNTIKDNQMLNISTSGVSLAGDNNLIINNTIVNSLLYGIDLLSPTNNIVINNNITGSLGPGIRMQYSNSTYILNNSIINNFDGMQLENCNDTQIESNDIIASNQYGISMVHVDFSNVMQNNISNGNGIGIFLVESKNNTFYRNTIMNNVNFGLNMQGSNENTNVSSNIFESNDYGIRIVDTNNSEIESNNITNSNSYGIRISQSANNSLYSNYITSSSLNGIYLTSSSDNTIYNNFFNNTANAFDDSTDGNNWNATEIAGTNIIGMPYIGGNFWSDYTGADNTGDYIGDTNLPYNASSNILVNGDYLPLVSTTSFDIEYPKFSNFWDNNATLLLNGTALFNVTVTSTNGTVILSINNTNYTATNLTADIYNVSIYMTRGVFNYYWQAYGNGTNTNYNVSQIISYTVNTTFANDTYSDFTGNTTDFNHYPDPSNVTNATLEVPGNGTIRWLVNVNATNQNFNINVNISYNTIYVNSSGLDSSFNNSAELTLYNLNFSNPKIRVALDDSTFVDCNATTDPACYVVSYNGGTFKFNVSHFTTYTAFEGSTSCGDTITTGTILTSDLLCNGTALNIGADAIVLDCGGYDIIGNRSGYGINLTGKNSFTVKDCTIKNFSYGIYMKSSNLTNVINNTLDNSTYGLYAESSNNLFFSNNTLINSGWQGMNLTLSNNTLVYNNNISFSVRAGLYAYGLNNSIIKNNYFSNNIFGGIESEYSENTVIAENNIINNPYIGIYVADSRNYNITKNQIFNNRWGIELFEFYGSTVTYNNVINSSGGSSSSGFTCDWTCVNITVSHNIFNNNSWYGFDCENDCFNSSIVNNTADYNNYGGFFIARSGNLTFIDNTANYNLGRQFQKGGFYIDSCQDIFLFNNTIKNNNYAGIQMAYGVTSGQISGNTIINNGNGTDDPLKSGVYFYNVSNFEISSNNITNTSHSGIYLNTTHNNFIINNTIRRDLDGIHAENSVNNTFVYNTIELSNQGIYLFPGTNNNVSFNNVTKNNIAIGFEGVNNSIFEGNNASNNSIGIDCYSNCYSNTFKNNLLNRNSDAGWACDSICPNNVVINNTASNNGYTGFACYNECQNITLANNTGNNNGYNGFECDWNCSDSIIIGNSFNNNTHYGFEAYEMSTSIFLSNAIQSNKGVGFYLNLGYNASLINNRITKNINYGIWIEETENATVLNNNLTLNYFGIFTAFGNYTNISGNDVSFSNDSGIYLEDCANNFVYNNTANYITQDVTITGIVVYGLATECPGNQVIKNNVSHNGNYGVLFDGCLQGNITENYIENNSQFGIYIFGSSNITASNNTLVANLNEIQVEDSNYNRLENNILIQNDQYGIYLLNSAYNLLIQNNISDGSTGISAVDSQNNTFYKNHIVNCINIGLDIHNNCHNSNASLNILSLNNYGLEIYNTNNSIAESNNITHSLTNGIYIYQSINNSIISNYIINTTLEGIYITSSSNNTIYNNFFNNTVNAIEFTAQDTNIWNNTYFCSPTTVNIIGHNCTGGNFWSDYTGSDNTGDYIGDTKLPYNASNALWADGDYLPLVSVTSVDTEYPKFSNFWDNNATLVLNGTALFNVTVKSTNGTVFLQINNTNYTATNLTANVYNVSVTDLINETYTYYWQAYGNGSNHYFNISNARSYTVLTTAPVTPVTPPSGGGGAGTSACTPVWSCDLAYSSCTNGFMTRNCTDLSNCKKSEKMPENCIYSPDSKCIQTVPCCISLTSVPENWSNCIDNIQSRKVNVYCDNVISSITQENYSCQFIEPQITYSPQAVSISTYSTKPILFKVDVKSKSILAEPSLIHINWYIGSEIVKQEFGKLELSSEFSQGFTQDATLKVVIIEQGFRKEILWSIKKKEYPSSSTLIKYGVIAIGAAIVGYILLQLVKLLVRQTRLIRLKKALNPPSQL